MSIEKNLERIADALEILAGSVPPAAAPAPAKAKKDKSPAKEETSEPEAAAPAPAKESGEAPTKDVVRDALKALGKRLDSQTARQVLADAGANTLTDLPEEQYQAVLDAIEKLMVEADAAGA